MLRFLVRFVGYWLLAGSLVAAVADGAKSIAASAVVLTPLSEPISALTALGRTEANAVAAEGWAWPFGPLRDWLLSAPLAVVLAVIAVLLLMVGRRRRSFAISREFAT